MFLRALKRVECATAESIPGSAILRLSPTLHVWRRRRKRLSLPTATVVVCMAVTLSQTVQPPTYLAGTNKHAGMVTTSMDARMVRAGEFVAREGAGAG
jgi:hypothetical protein